MEPKKVVCVAFLERLDHFYVFEICKYINVYKYIYKLLIAAHQGKLCRQIEKYRKDH